MAIYTSGFICQWALEEKDGVLSAVRIIDRIEVDIPTDVSPGAIVVAMQVACFAVLSFKSEGPEDFGVVFTAIAPNGQRIHPQTFKIHTDGGSHGHQMRIGMSFDPSNIGLWWIEVAVNGAVALRMPLALVLPTDPNSSLENRSQEQKA
jgi:hypothetical protein